jgi:hypothetical protein
VPEGRIRPVSKVSQPASVERRDAKLKSLCVLGSVSVISSLPDLRGVRIVVGGLKPKRSGPDGRLLKLRFAKTESFFLSFREANVSSPFCTARSRRVDSLATT